MSYNFKMKPYDHQMDALKESWNKEHWALFMDMGTGKTKVLIDNIGILYDKGKISGALIIAPKGVYRNWSDLEIPKHMADHIDTRVAYWKSGAGKAHQRTIASILLPEAGRLDILVMNIDAVNTAKGFDTAMQFIANHGQVLMGVDESTIIKNQGAKRTKRCITLGQQCAYRRVLSGSPVTKNPLDLYGQCQFLMPRPFGHKSFYTFRNQFAILREINVGNKRARIVVGYKNQSVLSRELQTFSTRVLKEDCLDLPPKVYTRLNCELTPEQKRMYKELASECITEMGAGEVSTTHMLTKLLRLQQIICGHILLDDDTEITPLPSNRMNVMMGALEEVNGKAIIWARFRHDIQAIVTKLGETYGEDAVVHYYGDTTDEEREQAKKDFEDPDSPVRFLVGNPQTGGYGLTLIQGTTVVYYSNSFDLEHRLQSEDRSHRAGQTNSVTYIDIIAEGTIDEYIVKALRNKIDIASAILGDDIKEWLV